MALIKNAELHFARVVPNRPNKKFNKENPTWEVQIRTYDVKQKKAWEAQGIRMKAVVPEEEGEKPYWKATLKKKIFKRDGTPSSPVEVKNGDLSEANPATIGNGSRGDVRVYQYEYGGDTPGIANVLQGIKLTKLVKYTPKAFDDEFEAEDMEVVEEEGDETTSDDDDDGDEDDTETQDEGEEEKPKKPSLGKPGKSKFD